MIAPRWFTPPQVARQLAVDPAKVVGWCKSGKLVAVNVSDGIRPRFRISPEALADFLRRRQATPPIKQAPRRNKVAAAKEYF
jgi:hypothetical protein